MPKNQRLLFLHAMYTRLGPKKLKSTHKYVCLVSFYLFFFFLIFCWVRAWVELWGSGFSWHRQRGMVWCTWSNQWASVKVFVLKMLTQWITENSNGRMRVVLPFEKKVHCGTLFSAQIWWETLVLNLNFFFLCLYINFYKI